MRKYNSIEDVLKMLKDRKAYIRYKISMTDEREVRKNARVTITVLR